MRSASEKLRSRGFRAWIVGGAVRDLALLWHQKAGLEATDRWTLSDFATDLDKPIPRNLGARHTTPRLRHVQTQLRSHGDCASITGTAKAKWTKLLQQGEADVRALRNVALAAAAGLATA